MRGRPPSARLAAKQAQSQETQQRRALLAQAVSTPLPTEEPLPLRSASMLVCLRCLHKHPCSCSCGMHADVLHADPCMSIQQPAPSCHAVIACTLCTASDLGCSLPCHHPGMHVGHAPDRMPSVCMEHAGVCERSSRLQYGSHPHMPSPACNPDHDGPTHACGLECFECPWRMQGRGSTATSGTSQQQQPPLLSSPAAAVARSGALARPSLAATFQVCLYSIPGPLLSSCSPSTALQLSHMLSYASYSSSRCPHSRGYSISCSLIRIAHGRLCCCRFRSCFCLLRVHYPCNTSPH